MSNEADASPGHIGKYRIFREIGRGSMGIVYLGAQESLGREVAIKVLAPEFTRDDEFLARFKREGETAGRLRHPNIVQVYDSGEHEGNYYIAMEYVGPTDLKQLISDSGGKLPLVQAITFAEQLLSALEHAHNKGIVHRDVKPANILISETGSAILSDFSVAQMKFAARLTQTGAAVGTPEYMAPEQFDGKNLDGRADLYAVGIIMYEMLTGLQPYRGDTLAEVMKAQLFKIPPEPAVVDPNIPAPLSKLVLKALSKDANNRFASAGEMLRALKQATEAPTPTSAEAYLDHFLALVAGGRISLDDANLAREKVKSAIDQGYRKDLTIVRLELLGCHQTMAGEDTLHSDLALRDCRSSLSSLFTRHKVMSHDWSGRQGTCIFETSPAAVKAAQEALNVVGEVAARHPGLTELSIRMGIHAGEVYLDPRRGIGEFTSPVIEEAGHVMEGCPPGSLEISASTAARVKGEIRLSEHLSTKNSARVFRFPPVESNEAAPARDSREGPPSGKISLADVPELPKNLGGSGKFSGSASARISLSDKSDGPPSKEGQKLRLSDEPSGEARPSVPTFKIETGEPEPRPLKLHETPDPAPQPQPPPPPAIPTLPTEEKQESQGVVFHSDAESPASRLGEHCELLASAIAISGLLSYLLAVLAYQVDLGAWRGGIFFSGLIGLPIMALVGLSLTVIQAAVVRSHRDALRSLLISVGLGTAAYFVIVTLIGNNYHIG